MKPLQIVACSLAMALAAVVHAANPPDPEIQKLLTEGQAAYMKGDIEGAKSAFEMVYSMDSRNITAINFLKKIAAEKGVKKGPAPIERQVAGIMIPQIQFKDATLGSALDYMKRAVNKASDGKVAVNFVVQLPPEQITTQTVTLSLNQVPFSEALKYLGTVASLEFVYDKYAIIVRPKNEAGATTSATAPTTVAPTGTNALPGAQ